MKATGSTPPVVSASGLGTSYTFTGYWWIGNVSVFASYSPNPTSGQQVLVETCSVPRSYKSDVFVCPSKLASLPPTTPVSTGAPTPPVPRRAFSVSLGNASSSGHIAWFPNEVKIGGGKTAGASVCFDEYAGNTKVASACRTRENRFGFYLPASTGAEPTNVVVTLKVGRKSMRSNFARP